jgi:signal peptidase I
VDDDLVPDESHDSSRVRMTVTEAARALGISESAVRKRVKRGMLEHERTPDGRLIVYLNSAATSAMSRERVPDESHDDKTERYVRSLEDRVGYLRDELDREREANRENSLIFTRLEERISKLEASQMAQPEPERREPHFPAEDPDNPNEVDEHPRVHYSPEDLKNEAVWAQFFVTAGASMVAAAVLVMSVLNGQVVLAGLAGGLTLLSIVSFLSHWLLFRFGTDRIQGRPSEPRSEASASRLEEPHQDRLVAKKTLPLPLDFLLQLLVCLALAFGVVKPLVVEPFYIPSESMVPTLRVGDRVLVNKFIYRFSEPQRGDIVVFRSVEGGGEDLIKRVVGLPGDKVELRHGKLFLDGQQHNEPYVVNKSCVRGMPKTCSYGPVTVPKGDYFMMGDNRAKSADSRFFGPVPKKAIIGEAFLRLWPPSRVGLLEEP